MVENRDNDEFAIKVLKSYIISLMKLMNMPIILKECNIDKNEFDKLKSLMAENALKDNCTSSNPKDTCIETITKLFELIY